MQINDILNGNFTAEEYLAHQREIHKERCDKVVAWVKKDISNESVISEKLKEAEYAMQNLFIIPGSRGVRIHIGTPPRWNDSLTDDEEGLWVVNRTHYFTLLSELYHLGSFFHYRFDRG